MIGLSFFELSLGRTVGLLSPFFFLGDLPGLFFDADFFCCSLTLFVLSFVCMSLKDIGILS